MFQHLILNRGEIPILHVCSDNTRAAALYRKLGFKHLRSFTVTVLKRSRAQVGWRST